MVQCVCLLYDISAVAVSLGNVTMSTTEDLFHCIIAGMDIMSMDWDGCSVSLSNKCGISLCHSHFMLFVVKLFKDNYYELDSAVPDNGALINKIWTSNDLTSALAKTAFVLIKLQNGSWKKDDLRVKVPLRFPQRQAVPITKCFAKPIFRGSTTEELVKMLSSFKRNDCFHNSEHFLLHSTSVLAILTC